MFREVLSLLQIF